jgi:histidinol-phosphate/aromatic aminotransferase/cobyric acid decarboxylase-like protein
MKFFRQTRFCNVSRSTQNANGASLSLWPIERVVDVDALLAACAKTKVVYIANPANPTGT